MKLTVVGCSGTLPGPASACSSYLVEHGGFRLLLDAGPGSIGVLQQHIGLLDLDAVIVSHLHPDHWLDLVCYSYARRYHPSGMPPPLPVYAPRAAQEKAMDAFDAPPPDRLEQVYEFRTLDTRPFRVGPFDVTTTRTNHPVECYALRVEAGGQSLTYSADTAESNAVIDLAQDTDLFLCEAAFGADVDHPPGLHLTGREAGRHARQANARRFVVTHLLPWADRELTLADARDAYADEPALATSGASYDI